MSARPAWDIELATHTIADAAAEVAARELDMALIEAQLADRYRDEGIAPLDPAQMRVETAKMSQADWQRLAVLVALFAVPSLRAALPLVSQRLHVREQIDALVRVAQALQPLELRALAASIVRAEELARRAARALDIEIAGETHTESVGRLAKIDYTRLLSSVGTVKAAADAKLAELLGSEDERARRFRDTPVIKPLQGED